MSLGMLGKYERLDVLGHGASSIVYLARDTLLRRTVAIKEIAAQGEEKSRFLEEARVLDRLRHPNIVRVNSVDTIGAKVVIDMEFVDGRNLQDILREADGPLTLPQALDIGSQICDGLAFAHANHTVHRDIKPANILIDSEGCVKLVDFGLAEVLGTNSYAGGAGTYAYMAPEDFGGDARSDAQSDLWSVGVILYEMLTGRRPFTVARPKDPFAWQRAVNEDTIAPPSSFAPEIPYEVDRVALKALARDKSQRYTSADQLLADIRRLQTQFVTVGAPDAHFIPAPTVGRSVDPAFSEAAPGLLPEAYTSEAPTLIGASDIDQFLNTSTERWEDARLALVTGALTRWLTDLGEEPLARVARTIQADRTTDEDQKLREFLYRAGLDIKVAARREAGIGNRLLRAGAYSEASEVLTKAINLDPNHASYYLLSSRALSAINDVAGAIVVLQKGVARFPRHAALRRELKRRGGARAGLSQDTVDFGLLRHGYTRMQRVLLRNDGDGLLQGRVASLPGWIHFTPMTFATRHRQPLTIVADTSQLLDGPGAYSDIISLETTGGRLEVVVGVRVLPPRPAFAKICVWYLPLLVLIILPLVAALAANVSHEYHPLYLVGMIVSGLLSASLLAITFSSDAAWLERLPPAVGVFLAPIGVAIFWRVAQSRHAGDLWPVLAQSVLPAIVLLALQGVAMMRAPDSVGRWQLWGWILAATCLALSFVLWNAPVWNGL